MVLSPRAKEVFQHLQIVCGAAVNAHDQLAAADKFLQKYRLQKEAWQIYIELLQAQADVGDAAGLLCAQALTYKVRNNWPDLDSTSRVQLRDTILAVLRTNRASNLLREVAVCLAVISLFMVEWQNPVNDIMTEFGAKPDLHSVLLEYLTVISEESFLMLSDARHGSSLLDVQYSELREREVQRLQNNAPTVLQFLQYLLSHDDDIKRKIMRCLASWLRQGHFTLKDIIDTSLMELPFKALEPDEHEYFDAAYEIITQSQCAPTELADQSKINIVMKVYSLLIPLRSHIATYSEEPEFLGFVCDLFVHFGSTHIHLLLRELTSFGVLIESILEFMGLKNFDILARTFHLWQTIDTYMYDDEKSKNPEYTSAKPQLQALFTQLLDILMPLLRYPDDFETWVAKDIDDFRDFRHDVGDILKICVVLAGAQVVLRRPFEMLKQVVAVQQMNQPINWKDVEAILFSIRAMGRAVSTDEKDVLPLVMELLPHLPDHPKIKYAAILVIGRYTKWTSTKDNLRYIPQQLNYIFTGFQDKEIVPAAALALKHLANDCGEALIPYLTKLYESYPMLMEVLGNDRIEYMAAIAHIISRLPPADLTEALKHFCVPLVENLMAISARGPNPENPRATHKEIDETIKYIIEYLKILTLPPGFTWDPTQPVYPVAAFVESIWPVLEKIMLQFPLITSTGIQLMREGIANYPAMLWKFMLTTLVPQLVELFEQTHNAPYLWLAKGIVRQYPISKVDGDGKILVAMVERLSATVFRLIEGNSVRGWEKYDILSDYFFLACATFDECTPFFIESSYFSPIIQFAIACLPSDNYAGEGESIDHTINAIVNFFELMFAFCAPVPKTGPDSKRIQPPPEKINLVLGVFMPMIPHIIAALFKALTSDIWVDSSRIKQAASIIKGLDKMKGPETRKAIVDVVASIPDTAFPSDAKQTLLNRIAGVIDSPRDGPLADFLMRYFVTPYRRANGL